jgi:histidinol-phosphate phosphatase family protein
MYEMEHLPQAVFIDRDGVIIEDHPSGKGIVTPDQVVLIQRSAEGIKRLNERNIPCFIVTNQPGVAKGYMTIKGLGDVHECLRKMLAEKGARVDGISFCPHHPDGGFSGEVKELKIDCECRKPKPGMLLSIIKEHGYKMSDCVMIGDRTVDIEAGKRAGCSTILVRTGAAGQDAKYEVKPDFIADDLLHAAKSLIERDVRRSK